MVDKRLDVLPVTPPELTAGRGGVVSRLAHHVGALFGVDTGTSAAGYVWTCDFNALTLAEVARGGPLPTTAWHQDQREAARALDNSVAAAKLGESAFLPAGEWWVIKRALILGTGALSGKGGPEIDTDGDFAALAEDWSDLAPATTNRYGPDRKAANVLVGANALFESMLETFHEVIRTLTTDDTDLRTKVATWALLVQEAQRSQPALFAAAVQARGVQRNLTIGWRPVDDGHYPVARSELGADGVPFLAAKEFAPRTLCILDDALKQYVKPMTNDGSAPANARFLEDDVVTLWTRHLLESETSGLVWLEDKAGKRSVQIFRSSTKPVQALLAELSFLKEVDLSADELERHLPRVPSAGEVAKLATPLQVAMIWTLVQLHRLLRQDEALDSDELRTKVTADARRTAQLATDVLGPDHPVTVWANNRAAVALRRDHRLDRNHATEDEAGAQLIDTTRRLQMMWREGLLPSGLYAEMLWANTFPLRQLSEDLSARERPDGPEVYALVRGVWEELFVVLGVDFRLELPGQVQRGASPQLRALAPHITNYVPLLLRSEDPAEWLGALNLMSKVAVPEARAASQSTGADETLRVSLQFAIGTIDRYLRLVGPDSADAHTWAAVAVDYTRELGEMKRVQQVEDDSSTAHTPSQWATLLRLLTGRVIAREHRLVLNRSDDAALDALLRVVACDRRVDPEWRDEDRPTGLNSDQTTVLRLARRIHQLSRAAIA